MLKEREIIFIAMEMSCKADNKKIDIITIYNE
jgi:hypothetical protein